LRTKGERGYQYSFMLPTFRKYQSSVEFCFASPHSKVGTQRRFSQRDSSKSSNFYCREFDNAA
jgi:hypothetical protein